MTKTDSLKLLILCLLNIALVMGSVFVPGSTLIAIVTAVWFDGLCYSMNNLEKRGALFSFLLSFFLLLIGMQFMERFGLHEVEAEFSDEINTHAEILLLISLIVLLAGYYISGKIRIAFRPGTSAHNNRSYSERDYNSREYFAVRKASKIMFLLTFAFNVFTIMDIVRFVFRYGYILFYTSYVSSVPYVIKKAGDMCLICFWIFLSTMPPKKEVSKLSVFYIIYLLLTLGTGKRFPFVAGLLTIFIYYIARNHLNSGNEIWISKKQIIRIMISAPIILWVLYIIGQVRVDRPLDALRVDRAIIDFLYDQGGTINVIKRADKFASRLPDKHYLFGSTYEAISNNIIFRRLGATSYSGNTIRHALEGYSFQHALSYVTMGQYYLLGHGLGSCYIAEAYYDYGYAGVIAVNFIYGVIFRKAFDLRRHGIWITAIILSMLYSLFLAPRGSADGFITDLVDLTTWGTIIVVWVFSEVILYRNASVRTHRSENGI